MFIVSWNINGVNAHFDSVVDFLKINSIDILFLQEIKTDKMPSIPGYIIHINPSDQRHHHGTAVIYKNCYTNIGVENVQLKNHPNEGRIQKVILNHDIHIVNVYVPNSGVSKKNPLQRLDYRWKEWDTDFFQYLLDQDIDLVCGDFNVALYDYDVHNPKTLQRKAGFTMEERTSFETFLTKNEVTSLYDHFNPNILDHRRFTFFGPFQQAYKRGWRLDYWLCMKKQALEMVKQCHVIPTETASDHLPLLLEIDKFF